MNLPSSYTLIREEFLEELNSKAYILRHPKSGARLFLLSNDDNNKVFAVGFRTPVSDSTGVPHILEHSVLCGSKKFPVKDPFIELEKSSLQTYLNAMTFADKTVYPVASCNDQDFQNLMDVYLDAVLNPMIYQNPKIFQQEGWHYELESAENELTINGVVYNEMKGAFSAPEEVLERYSQAVLFPDTTYHFESGGDPEEISSLTYEGFLDFHRTYYHPSNSYIYLYGDMDIEEKLRWLDQEYLNHYDAIRPDSEILLQKPFEKPAEAELFYPLAEGESSQNQTYMSLQWVIGEITDQKLYMAFQILDYVLLSAQGAPLKQALLDAGIGKDVFGGYRNWTLQPYFSLVVKNSEKQKRAALEEVVRATLEEIVKEGLPEKSLRAAINNLEFRNREADFGSYPKGLMYGIACFDSWLYDEKDPLMHLKYEEPLAFLKAQIGTGYFEALVERYLLQNNHRATVILSPKAGLSEAREETLRKELAAYKGKLSAAEVEVLVEQTRALALYQDTPPAREELDTLPMLSLQDIPGDPVTLRSEEKSIGDLRVIHHQIFTGGIAYLRLLYDVSDVTPEDLPYLGLLRSLLCLVSTGEHTYQDLYHEMNIVTGGVGCSVTAFEQVENPGEFTPYFEIHTKVLYDQMGNALSLMGEILRSSLFTEEKRLKELISQFKSRAEMQLLNGGHSTAVLRAASYGSPVSYFNEQIGGIDYFRFLEDLEASYPQEPKKLQEKLQELVKRIFISGRLLVSCTCDQEGFQKLAEQLPVFAAEAAGAYMGGPTPVFPLERKNEGFKTASRVQYVAQCGNFRKAGLPYKGSLRVLKAILGDEYLWNNVRVKGGAYGCMCNFGRNGSGFFVSYRDPNLKKTLEVYDRIVSYLENFTIEEKDMTKFIIGAIGTMDRPMNPSEWGVTSLQAYLGGITDEMRRRDREEILSCSQAEIRSLRAQAEAVLSQKQLCVVGNAVKIEEDRDVFSHTENLFRTVE